MKKQTHCKFGHEFTEENTSYLERTRFYADGTPYTQIERRCKECIRENGRKQYAKNPEIMKQRSNTSAKKRLKELRAEAIEAYGGKCNCLCGCGIKIPEYLHLDHVNDDGAEHRKELGFERGSSDKMVKWAKKNNWPEKLQLLCHNCGMSKAWYGQCPLIEVKQCQQQ